MTRSWLPTAMMLLAVAAIWSDMLRAADAPDAEAKAAIRKAAPTAAAVDARGVQALARLEATPKAKDFENQTLTALFFTIPFAEERTEAQVAEFEMLQDSPKPAQLIKALETGIPESPLSLLRRDHIVNVSVEVAGDAATGAITFKAPGEFRGKVAYRAKKIEGAWTIVEFSFPAHGLKTSLGEDKKWKIEEIKQP